MSCHAGQYRENIFANWPTAKIIMMLASQLHSKCVFVRLMAFMGLVRFSFEYPQTEILECAYKHSKMSGLTSQYIASRNVMKCVWKITIFYFVIYSDNNLQKKI